MYPISDLLRGPSLAAPPIEGFLAHTLPALHKKKQTPSQTNPGFEKLELKLNLPHAAVGVLNITGPLQSWSWAETLPHTMLPVSRMLQAVRILHRYANLAARVWACSCSLAILDMLCWW